MLETGEAQLWISKRRRFESFSGSLRWGESMRSPHAVDRLTPLLIFHLPRLQPRRLSPDAQVKNVKSYLSKDDQPLMFRLWSRRPS
jgi:hypothetical protein